MMLASQWAGKLYEGLREAMCTLKLKTFPNSLEDLYPIAKVHMQHQVIQPLYLLRKGKKKKPTISNIEHFND